jgi:hypothetical protein
VAWEVKVEEEEEIGETEEIEEASEGRKVCSDGIPGYLRYAFPGAYRRKKRK